MNNDQQSSGPESSGPESSAEKSDDAAITENVQSRSTWLRLFFMVVCVFLGGVARIVTGAVVVVQFFWVLFTGSPNENLLAFGQSLASYVYQIVRYLTFNTEQRPFPFDLDWPEGPPPS
ncbi:MAG: DUF4389 domain-containing protein [Gammaproteobacteria bacterium]